MTTSSKIELASSAEMFSSRIFAKVESSQRTQPSIKGAFTNDSSSPGNSTSDSDESDEEEILRSHPPPGTYLPLIERRRDSPANSPPDSLPEEEEEEAAPKRAGQKNPGADEANFKDPSTTPEPRRETT